MILIMLAAVCFVWAENLKERMRQPEHQPAQFTLAKTRRRVKITAWVMLGLAVAYYAARYVL